MPINTDLNIAPYFDDFDIENQFYKILFKPAYAVQARELTQLQTILQNQVEQFGDNIFQDGSIIKGCTFTDLDGLQYVKVVDKSGVDVQTLIGGADTDIIGGVETEIDVAYELEGVQSGLKANIVSATRGFETRPPNLNTFYINYTNSNETGGYKQFIAGEQLRINRYKYNGGAIYSSELNIENINVTLQTDPVGKSFGIQSSAGVIFQKGHFLFSDAQTLIVSKYDDNPDGVSVGFEVKEELISSLQDPSLYDNANGSSNENAPGADRLKLIPSLVTKDTTLADVDSNFFSLIRYKNGAAVTLRDVSQFNSIATELANRTYEESGNYVVERFKVNAERRNNVLNALVGKGIAYVKGYRVEQRGDSNFAIDEVANTFTQSSATSFNYGAYVNITTANTGSQLNLEYDPVDLINSSNAKIGTAFVRNITPSEVYLFAVNMTGSNSIKDVVSINNNYLNADKVGIDASSILHEQHKAPAIFPTGTSSIKSITNINLPVRVSKDITGIAANQFTVVADADTDFAVENTDMLFVDASNKIIPITNYTTSNNNTELNIDLDPAYSSDSSGKLYYNIRKVGVEPYNKVAVEPYIKVNFTSATTKYSLGFPDVVEIMSVQDTALTEYKDSFRLQTNQKDGYYDISYMEYIPGRPLPANGVLTIQLKVFQLNTSTGDYFFNVNSYPVDDTSTSLPAGKIRSWSIPVYTGKNGIEYNLRECYDFRPYVNKDALADYNQLTPASAPTITTAVGAYTVSFSDNAGNHVIPALNGNSNADIEAYNKRIDVITMNSYGILNLVKGNEADRPIPPKTSEGELAICTITIPGYPALSPKEAAEQNKRDYAIKTQASGTEGYTMRDIAKIERKVESLEYYISLSQLEQDTENLLVLDENGLTRFKNGYVVDPFKDLNIANLIDPEFNAAVMSDREVLTPKQNHFPLDLKYKSGSNALPWPTTGIPEVGTLSRNVHVELLGQKYATNYRSCVSNFWKYDGIGQLSPQCDILPDVDTNPEKIELDLATPFKDFVTQFQKFYPLTKTDWKEIVGTVQIGDPNVWQRTEVQRGIESQLEVGTGKTKKIFDGSFVTDVAFEPYMRSKEIKIFVSGLRPNTRHYFYFDGEDVSSFMYNGTNVTDAAEIEKLGEIGQPIKGPNNEDIYPGTTDDDGVLTAVFGLPGGKFFVGERVLTIVDVPTYDNIDSASSSKAELTYYAYNVGLSSATLSTRPPEFTIRETETTRNLPRRRVPPQPSGDPIAQTFFIKKAMGQSSKNSPGSNSVFASKIDLYFKRKSDAGNGITVMLREVVNGYPSSEILPFSKVHIDAEDVNVSDNGESVTTVEFRAPIRLDTETEYAFVIMPDANDPNYLIYTSKVGGISLGGSTIGQAVSADWGDGVLFASTNNRAWKSYQDEDIKFTLYRHDFNALTGSVTMTNNDHEFFTLSSWSGRFNGPSRGVLDAPAEMVYKSIANSESVSLTTGNNVITSSTVNFETTYSAGDYVHVNDGGSNKEIFRIANVDSATEMTLTKPSPFTASNGAGEATPIVAGLISHYSSLDRSVMHLQASSATSTKKFVAGDTITGFDSGTTATIGTIDDINLSYIQPMIMKANDSITNVTMNGTFVDSTNPINTYNTPMNFGSNLYFNNGKGVVVYSKSNDPSRTKPFDITLEMENRGEKTSTPIIDFEVSGLLAYQYEITNTSSATSSKYISIPVELAEDLDAEDMEVIVTGFRPEGTNIKVYIRPQNPYDSSTFDNINWIELELFKGVNTYSNNRNLNDWREFRYKVADANKDSNGILQYTSDAGTFSGYRTFAIKIEMLAPTMFDVPTLKDYRAIALT